MEEQTKPDAATTTEAPVESPDAPVESTTDVPVETIAPDAATSSTMDIVDSVNTATQGAATHAGATDMFVQLSHSSIYMMGISFVLGSLFTILVLILLDFMRRNSEKK